MSKWISEVISDKQRRLAAGARAHRHLQAYEGSKIADGLAVGDTVLDKIRRFFRPKPRAPQLHVIDSPEHR